MKSNPPGTAEARPAPAEEPVTPSANATRTAHRALAAALAAGALGAALVLVAAGKTWTRGTAPFGGGGTPVHATGTQTTALAGGLALVGLASLVAVFAVRRLARYAVAALLALSGLGVAVTVPARRGDHHALDDAAATATGLSRTAATHVTLTAWPWVATAGGVLLFLAGLLALRYGSRWPAMSSRYDRPTGRGAAVPGARRRPAAARRAPAPVDPDRPESLWQALDRGEDPTSTGD
ncbi:TIGR02234 family membrane protein [Streptomyces sp. HPF1205]|uniref:TIGR02234 family membrane protein n=1 Tax=Streptomyces sp. HPF1205 TaxID=2873262 RepID=UPI001CECF42E|nr:TIGR02234 family membrane protein [Streptomyces sp. HPF1205]